MAEALRLEVAPFGVDVLSVVTGGVRTRGQTYFDDFALPRDSRYRGIEDTIASRAQGGDGHPRTELMEYAEQVAEAIASRKTGRIWVGGGAEATRDATNGSVPQDIMVGDSESLIGRADYLRTALWSQERAWISCREARQSQSMAETDAQGSGTSVVCLTTTGLECDLVRLHWDCNPVARSDLHALMLRGHASR